MSEQINFDREIKLYSLLVDQLFKHQTHIWQIPTALLSVNLVAIYNFQQHFAPLVFLLIVLWIFNAGLIFVFWQMINAQKIIIETIMKAEEKLKPVFSDYLPFIKSPAINSSYVFLGILVLLEIILAGFIICLCSRYL